jgi:TRAP-type C4-dicarboxylate transport system permease small subunit
MAHGLDDVETAQAAAPTGAAHLGAAPSGTAPMDGAADRVLALVNALVVKASSIALVAAGFVLTYSVIVRYFLKISTDWQDEMSVFLIVGAVFMSSAAVQALRGHVAIEAIVGLLPPRVNFIRQILVDLASFAFCAFFAWKSWTLLHEAVVEGYHSGSTWGPPLWIPYSLMAVGMTLLSLQILLQVAAELRHRGRAR